MKIRRGIWCVACQQDVLARLTDGGERYPHRPDLKSIPFWKCDTCKNYVGCHHKTNNPTKPLGCIATPELLDARKKLHDLIDPAWKSGLVKRGQIYAHISRQLGYQYHTGELRSLEEARTVWGIAAEFINQLEEEKIYEETN